MAVKMSGMVRLSNGEITTLKELADKGLLVFTTGIRTSRKIRGEIRMVRYFRAELKDGSGYWDISEVCYQSRTGDKSYLNGDNSEISSHKVPNDTGTPWLNNL